MRRTANLAGLACLPFVVVWLADGFWKQRLEHVAVPLFWAVDFVEWLVLPAVSLALLHRLAPISRRDYGLAWPGARRFAAELFLCTVTLFVANFFGGQMLGPMLFGNPRDAFDLARTLASYKPLAIIGTFYLAASAGVCESLFALALPWLWFSQGESVSRGGKAAFALASSFIFALAHWETGWANATGAFAFQLVAVAWYLRFGGLWPIIGAHFLIDLYWFWPQ